VQDARAVYDLIERAFSEWPGREPTSFEDWASFTIGRRDFDPALLHVAIERERIVGASVGLDFPAEGELWVAGCA
jgi:hypothetical protein